MKIGDNLFCYAGVLQLGSKLMNELLISSITGLDSATLLKNKFLPWYYWY